MFTRKYQRIAAEHRDEGTIFLEIMGDESADTRVTAPMPVPLGVILPRSLLQAFYITCSV